MSSGDSDGNAASPSHKRPGAGARHGARLAAVQALYQMELAGAPVAAVVSEFLEHRFADPETKVDQTFFEGLTREVVEHQVAVDQSLAKTLVEGWELERLDSTLRALLRAGTCELLFRPDVPARVVLNEYVEIAHDFFGGEERAFANGVLNRIARASRSAEFTLPSESAPG